MTETENGHTTDDAEVDPAAVDWVVRPLKAFARHKLAGAGLLLTSTIIALVWASSPFGDVYRALLNTELTVGFEAFRLQKPLLLWVNDALMGVFFFLVGLEIKRELVAGELRSPRRAALPLFAAVGGMVVPALVYLAFNAGGPAVRGWGVPMATDIAFALGVLALLGNRIPVALKVFLTALAIVDDIGSIVVIAFVYTESVAPLGLLIGGGLLVLSAGLNRAGVRSSVVYFIIGALVWLAFLKSGVHATLAAVLMAFTIPARGALDAGRFMQRIESLLGRFRTLPDDGDKLLSLDQQHLADDLADAVDAASAPLLRLEHALVPVSAFLVLPLFALANAGVPLGAGGGADVPIALSLGIVGGLVVGKPVGVVLMSFIAVKLRVAELPTGATWRSVIGVGFLAGIGFTMSLFVASLAYVRPEFVSAAKTSTLIASVLAAAIGVALLWKRPLAKD